MEGERQRPAFSAGTIIGVLVGLVLPVIGLIVAVVFFAKGRTGPGSAVLAASAVGVLLNLIVLTA